MDDDILEAVEACRTCGVYYMVTSNYLQPLFQSPVENPEMMLIRLELASWKVEICENDIFSHYVCSSCIYTFQQMFKFRKCCVDTQEQFRHFYSLKQENEANLRIKAELIETTEEEVCNFIYIDDLSDTEYDDPTPFKTPHVPIKEECIEEATIPTEHNTTPLDASHIMEATTKFVSISPAANSIKVQKSLEKDTSLVHTQTLIESENLYECQFCQHLSSNLQTHRLHMSRVHERRNLECHICGKKFKNSTMSRLKCHMKWHNLSKHVKCTQCSFACNSHSVLKEHTKAMHSRLKCKICGKMLIISKMKSHLRRHENHLNKFSCEYCELGFANENDRECHIWDVHPEIMQTNFQKSESDVKNSANISNEGLNFDEIIDDNENRDAVFIDDEDNKINVAEYIDDDDDLIISYELLCAHCDAKFIEQKDLEWHIKNEHKLNLNTSNVQNLPENLNIKKEDVLDDEVVDIEEITEDDDAETITVYEDYDDCSPVITNVDEQQQNILQLEKATSNMNTDQDEIILSDYEMDSSLHSFNEQKVLMSFQATETLCISSDDSDIDTEVPYINEFDIKEEVDENAFACAKCPETFSTIESLREHHQQHLQSNHQQQQQERNHGFRCHICDKHFDLKFSFNRHMKKH